MSTRPPDPVSTATDETSELELQQQFGASFRAAREVIGLIQSEVSKRSSVDQGDILKIERGLQNLSLKLIRRLGDAVDHDVSMLLTARVRPARRK